MGRTLWRCKVDNAWLYGLDLAACFSTNFRLAYSKHGHLGYFKHYEIRHWLNFQPIWGTIFNKKNPYLDIYQRRKNLQCSKTLTCSKRGLITILNGCMIYIYKEIIYVRSMIMRKFECWRSVLIWCFFNCSNWDLFFICQKCFFLTNKTVVDKISYCNRLSTATYFL